MTELPINPQRVARAFDNNRDGKVSDELKVKADSETLRALGGDADVTVDELAKALNNDNVIIKNGEIQANPKVTLRVPLLLEGYGDAQAQLRTALSRLQTFAQAPERPLSSRADDMERQHFQRQTQEVSDAHSEITRQAYDSLSKLTQSAFELNDAKFKALLESTSRVLGNSPRYPDSQDRDLNQLLYAKSQAHHIKQIQQAFRTLGDHLNRFEQPLSAARGADRALDSAQQQLDREQQAVRDKSKAVDQLQQEIQEIQDGWNPVFRESRIEDRKATIAKLDSQVDAYSAHSRQDKLDKLARQNYENVVQALDGYDFEEAAGIKTRSQELGRDAQALARQAESNADLVEDALD